MSGDIPLPPPIPYVFMSAYRLLSVCILLLLYFSVLNCISFRLHFILMFVFAVFLDKIWNAPRLNPASPPPLPPQSAASVWPVPPSLGTGLDTGPLLTWLIAWEYFISSFSYVTSFDWCHSSSVSFWKHGLCLAGFVCRCPENRCSQISVTKDSTKFFRHRINVIVHVLINPFDLINSYVTKCPILSCFCLSCYFQRGYPSGKRGFTLCQLQVWVLLV
jgi:hypothetical protein